MKTCVTRQMVSSKSRAQDLHEEDQSPTLSRSLCAGQHRQRIQHRVLLLLKEGLMGGLMSPVEIPEVPSSHCDGGRFRVRLPPKDEAPSPHFVWILGRKPVCLAPFNIIQEREAPFAREAGYMPAEDYNQETTQMLALDRRHQLFMSIYDMFHTFMGFRRGSGRQVIVCQGSQ